MSSETLVTFLLESGPRVPYVELFGSWDNFSRAYPMRKDDQKGSGHWLGCHLFKNIICDGDPSASVAGREGCLREGGTYWYYYKREDDVEFHNPAEPFTTNCPLLPGQIVNILEIPSETVSTIASTSEVKLQRSFTLNPADRRRNPKPPPRKTKSLNTNKKSKPLNNAANRLSRQKWFDDSTGRLQTAAAHDIIKSFFTMDDGTADSNIRPRNLKSSSDAGTFAAAGVTRDLEMEKTVDLDKRPSTRHGLLKDQPTLWDFSKYTTKPTASPLLDQKSELQKVQSAEKRPSTSGCARSTVLPPPISRPTVSAPATPQGVKPRSSDYFSFDGEAPRTSDATERPHTSWSFEPSPRGSWENKGETQPIEPSTAVDTNFDFQLDVPAISTAHNGWSGMLDPISQDPLSYSRSETSASSVGVGIWDNDGSSKQTSYDDYYDISHESPATTYRNSLEHSNKIKGLAASLSSSIDDSLLLKPIGNFSRNSWDPKLASQETIKPTNDDTERNDTTIPPPPARAPPPPPPAHCPPPIPKMPSRAPPLPPPQISLPDTLEDISLPFFTNTTIPHRSETPPSLNLPDELSSIPPPRPPKRAPPPPPLHLAPRRYEDETGYNPDSPYNLSPALSTIDRPQLGLDITQELRAAVAGIAAAGGASAKATEPKSPHDAILSDLGYLAGAIV